jgi:GNAT superfamily N-acetyltransferase
MPTEPSDSPRITLASTVDDFALAKALLDEYYAWALDAAGYAELAEVAPEIAHELAHLADHYRSFSAYILLAWDPNGTTGGVCAVEQIDPTSAELKRLYIRPSARRHGLAWHLTARSVDLARAMGCRTLRLDTHEGIMQPAIALYRRFGFVPSTRCTTIAADRVVGFELDLTRYAARVREAGAAP